MFRNCFSIGGTHSRFRKKFKGNSANNDAIIADIGNAIEIRQTDARDNSACERGFFDDHHLCPCPRCSQSCCRSRTPRTTNQDINIHVFTESYSWSFRGCNCIRASDYGCCRCGGLNKLPAGRRIIMGSVHFVHLEISNA